MADPASLVQSYGKKTIGNGEEIARDSPINAKRRDRRLLNTEMQFLEPLEARR